MALERAHRPRHPKSPNAAFACIQDLAPQDSGDTATEGADVPKCADPAAPSPAPATAPVPNVHLPSLHPPNWDHNMSPREPAAEDSGLSVCVYFGVLDRGRWCAESRGLL